MLSAPSIPPVGPSGQHNEGFKKPKKTEASKKRVGSQSPGSPAVGRPQFCHPCEKQREVSGAWPSKCRHHRHAERMSENEGAPKEPKEGAAKRVLQKHTKKCDLGCECKFKTHLHNSYFDDDEESNPKICLPLGIGKLTTLPKGLEMTSHGLVDWEALLQSESRHLSGTVFSLRHNAHEHGEKHHHCLSCDRDVVRLSGLYSDPRPSRPCYKCLGMDVPYWYMLVDKMSETASIREDSDDEYEDEPVNHDAFSVYSDPAPAVITEFNDSIPTLEETGYFLAESGSSYFPLEVMPHITVSSVLVADEITSPAAADEPLPALAVDNISAVLPSQDLSPCVEQEQVSPPSVRNKIEVSSGKTEIMNYNPLLWSFLVISLVFVTFLCRVKMHVDTFSCVFMFAAICSFLMLIPYCISGFLFPASDQPQIVRTLRSPALPVTPKLYFTYYLSIQLIIPVVLIWVAFDIFIWPGFCIILTEMLQKSMGSFGYLVGFAVFQAENVATILYGLGVTYVSQSILTGFSVHRDYHFFECDQPLAGHRPKKASYNKVDHVMDIKMVHVNEIYSFSIPQLGISFDFLAVLLKKMKISGTLYFDETAVCVHKRTGKELENYLQGTFEKAGYIDWDREFMSDNNILSNTKEAVTAYYLSTASEETINPLSHYNLVLSGPSSYKPWWLTGPINSVLTLLAVMGLIGGFLFMSYQTLCLINTAVCFTTGLIEMMLGAMTVLMTYAKMIPSIPPLAHAETEVLPKGYFGFRVYDTITGHYDSDGFLLPMKTNPVGNNKNLKIRLDPKVTDSRTIPRKMTGVFAPFFIPGFTMPEGDYRCPLTFWSGLIHRGAGETPAPDQSVLDSKKEYCNEMLTALVTPAEEYDVMSVETALAGTSYPEKRKDQIRAWEDEAIEFDPTSTKITAPFSKCEKRNSTEKHDRTIQGGHETLWASGVFGNLGRFVKTMEHAIYPAVPCNIKQKSPAAQIEKIKSLGPGRKTCNDFSSYEASFSRPVQESAQFVAYDWFFQNTSYAKSVPAEARKMLGSKNTMKTKYGNASIENLKCSGDFDTSFSNWWDNVITICHIFQQKFSIHWTDAIDWILCEGDDNITDDHDLDLTNADFSPYGLTAKVEIWSDLREAGFCQRFINNDTLLMDPLRYFGKCQTIPIEYANAKISKQLAMCKAKAMSVLSFTANCPVISEHAWRVLELTKGIYVSKKMLVKAKKYGVDLLDLTNFKKPVILESDRLAMSDVFGFSIDQQLLVTKTLNSWVGGPLYLPPTWFPENWVEFYDDYCTVDAESDLVGWGNDAFFDYFTGRVGEVVTG